MRTSLAIWREHFDLKPKRLARGQAVSEQISSHNIFLVGQGVVKLTHTSKTGDRVVFGFRRQGQFIVVGSHEADVFCISAVAATDILLYSVSGRRGAIGGSAAVTPEMLLLDQLRFEIGRSLREADELRNQTATGRLELLLCRLADMISTRGDAKGERSFRMPMTNRETARLISVTPEHFSRIKKRMIAERRIETQGEIWTIRSPHGHAWPKTSGFFK